MGLKAIGYAGVLDELRVLSKLTPEQRSKVISADNFMKLTTSLSNHLISEVHRLRFVEGNAEIKNSKITD